MLFFYSDLTLHLDSRIYFFKYVVKQAKANGMLSFRWDAGNLGDNGLAIFKRTNNSVFDTQALTVLQDELK